MLKRQDETQFCSGFSRYADRSITSQEPTAKIFVKIEPVDFGAPILAQLDTGAAWSILNQEVAEAISLLNGQGEPKTISTRLGPFTGRLERTQIQILADFGDALSVQATVFVSPDWTGGNFIGYSGFLERIRFAIDPRESLFYFGEG